MIGHWMMQEVMRPMAYLKPAAIIINPGGSIYWSTAFMMHRFHLNEELILFLALATYILLLLAFWPLG